MSKDKILPEEANPDSATTSAMPAADHASEAERATEKKDRISARAHWKSQHRIASTAGTADKDWLEAEREIDSATKGDRR